MNNQHTIAQALKQWRAAAVERMGPVAFRAYAATHRDEIVQTVASNIRKQSIPRTEAERIAANLAILDLLNKKSNTEISKDELAILDRYTGWSGLPTDAISLEDSSLNFKAPDEVYTPIHIANAIGESISDCLTSLAGRDGSILALDPAAGTGRLIRGIEATKTLQKIKWTGIEVAPISSRILTLLHPNIAVYAQSFETWIAEHGPQLQGRLRLVVCNPPFSERGLAIDDDDYREGSAPAYFVRRSLDLLAPGGLGVAITPHTLLSHSRATEVRRRVLMRHQLLAAYRLPVDTFPGGVQSDVLFFRARGGELTEPDEQDAYILAGEYFESHPTHILEGSDIAFPAVVERGACFTCCPPVVSVTTDRSTPSADPLEIASSLGYRIMRLRSLLSDGDPTGHGLWVELRRDIEDFRGSAFLCEHKGAANPWLWPELVQAAADEEGLDSYLNAFTRDGDLETWIDSVPSPYRRYRGDPANIADQAMWLYRLTGALELDDLESLHSDVGGRLAPAAILDALIGVGWNVAAHHSETRLEPDDAYLSGDLWRKLDALRGRDEPHFELQAERLHQAIAAVPIEDLDLSPRSGWIPTATLGKWIGKLTGDAVKIERRDGLLQIEGVVYDEAITDELRCLLTWLNYDSRGFRPRKSPAIDVPDIKLDQLRDVDRHRQRWGARWKRSFRAFATAFPGRRAALSTAYNRALRGLVRREYDAAPLVIPRWSTSMRVRLRPHQIEAARRAIDERQGLIALDTGLGKTYTGLAVLATARSQGWAKRPVIVAPNGLVWKWFDDIGKVLRDYRVAVIGSHRYRRNRGADVQALRERHERGELSDSAFEAAMVTSRNDTADDRKRKWEAFAAGGYDAVIMTPQAMGQTTVSEDVATAYIDDIDALARARSLGRTLHIENGRPEGLPWDFVDFLLIDEAADYKNLFTTPAVFGDTPKFAGGTSVSARAWQLHLRAYATRQLADGRGVVMLTATPMKNSPIELYSLLHTVNPSIWERAGIFNVHQFADRFLRIELADAVPDCDMNIAAGPAVVGFRNLEELRAVLGQVVELKSAEDANLRLPIARKHIVEVDLDPAQAAKYAQGLGELRDGLTGHGRAATVVTQMRLALVGVHHALDDGYTWENAETGIDGGEPPDPMSPKFQAIADRVVASSECGHIVFLEPKAGHRWLRQVLIAAGIPAERIAIMNSDANTSAERLQLARGFNGTDGDALYDVLIANSVAYEGMNLQARTCAIHHADLPWTVADLEQRNGRGLRDGNTRRTLEIYYYVSRKSTDRYRLATIDGKANWLQELLAGKTDIHNPAGAVFHDAGELLIQLAERPEEAKEVLGASKVRHARETSDRAMDRARLLVKRAASRFREARESSDPQVAIQRRSEGIALLVELRGIDTDIWPWERWIDPIVDVIPLVPRSGPPVYEGMRITREQESRIDAFEFGRVRNLDDEMIGLRRAGSGLWVPTDTADVERQAIKLGDMPGMSSVSWPAKDVEESIAWIEKSAATLRSVPWIDWGWSFASQDFLELIWPRVGHVISQHVRHYGEQLPTVTRGRLLLARGRNIAPLLPPTLAGWHRFVRLTQHSEVDLARLQRVADYWWGRELAESEEEQ